MTRCKEVGPLITIWSTAAGMAAECGALLTAGAFVPAAMADPVLPAYTVGGGCSAGPDFVAPDPFCSQSPGIKNSPVATPEPGTVLLIFALSPLVLLARRFRAV
jgi:hypothetical protein